MFVLILGFDVLYQVLTFLLTITERLKAMKLELPNLI